MCVRLSCSIEGEGCNLEVLSALSETTGGSVLNVNPADLTKNFARCGAGGGGCARGWVGAVCRRCFRKE